MTSLYKWVEIKSGTYRLVDRSDPRPEVKLKSNIGSPNVLYTPSWKKYEMPMFFSDPKDQMSAADKFIQSRDEEIKRDSKAARWEKSRKEWFQKQKHSWREKELKKLREQGI